jgi:hypothetical protein
LRVKKFVLLSASTSARSVLPIIADSAARSLTLAIAPRCGCSAARPWASIAASSMKLA